MKKLIRYIIIASCFLTWCFTLLLPDAATAQTKVGFSIEGATVIEKNTFTIAVKADTVLTGKGIYSFRFGFTFNADYLEFQNIDSVGKVLQDWGMPTFSNKTRGSILIAGAGASALTGKGNMFYLRFKALLTGGTYINFTPGVSYLNEGLPAMTMNNAYILANGRSYPDIYPDDIQLFVGAEAQMNTSGGTAPFVYTTVDTAVAIMSSPTMVKAKAPGYTKVFVTDKNGDKSYMTGNVDVRAIKMSISRVSAWPQDTFYLPVKIEIAPGTRVRSGYFEITYNGNVQGIKESAKIGDYTISIQNNTAGNLMRISFASTAGITGSGILCYLGFKAINSGNHYFNFQNMQFDETLRAFATTEYVEVYSLPTLNISPNTGTMMWGTTQKITVTNGTPPITYKVSDPALASIDVQGNLQGKSGGNVKVTATDFHGATKTSGDFLILDNQFSIVNMDGVLDGVTRVPISSTLLPAGKAVYDFDGSVSFNVNDVDFLGIDPIDVNMLTSYSLTGNTVHIVGATSTGIQSGIICYLKFKLKNTVALNQQTPITLNALAANESSLHSTLASGKITRVTQVSYRPVALAGLNKTVQEGETVLLDGSASYDLDGNPITFSWRSPAGIHLNDSTLKKPTFVAPIVTATKNFTFTLVVNDGTSDSDPSTVTITVQHVNKRPVANAGPDISYNEGSSVSLDGNLSYDPDLDVISYKWTSLDGIILFDALGPAPSFIAPQVSTDKSYRFKLDVSDGVLTSLADTVVIKVLNVNKKPVAFAGVDQTVNEGTLVQLDGTLSSDADNETITFKWTAPAIVVLSSQTISKPTFTAPMVHRDSVLVISLVVNDGKVNSDIDQVSITIKNLNILSTEAQILKATLTGADSTKVDQVTQQVTLYMPYGTDIRALAPTFQLSPKAFSVVPASGSIRNFTTPVSYTITAEDGLTQKVYLVRVFVPNISLKRTLAAGWNWISLSATPADFAVGTVLGGLSLANLDYIKSPTQSAVYYSNTGWFGDLGSLPQLDMLMLKKSTSGVLTISGKEINPTLTSIPVSTGWNRIGYILKGNAAINQAFDQTTLPTGDILLKSKEASAIYYPGTGWIGDLDSMRVMNGYMMKTASNSEIKYKSSGAKLKSVRNSLLTFDDLYTIYKINPSEFENSSTLIGEIVNENGKNIIRQGDILIAYVGTANRGVTEARFVPDLNRYVFILTMFSNLNQEKMSFKMKSPDDNFEKKISDEIEVTSNEVVGLSMNPYPLHLSVTTGIMDSENHRSLSVYPNPVTDKVQIRSGSEIFSVTVSGITGETILYQPDISENTVVVDTRNLAPGLYLLKIETSNGTICRKLIKSSN
jgi:hypothetical protein